MTAGFDRYFQIAPCFRDEDARGDRSPGEFYQLDMEMAFATQDDVFAVLEDVLPPIFAKYGKYDIASEAPFRRISYHDAMETYGSDKPDLRIDLTVQDMTALVAGSDFAPFAGATRSRPSSCPTAPWRARPSTSSAPMWRCRPAASPYWFKVDEQGNFAGGIESSSRRKPPEITAALGLKPGCFRRRDGRQKTAAQRRADAHQLGMACRATWTKERLRILLDRRLPDVRDRRGVRRAGVLPQPVLDAERRPRLLEKAERGEVDPLDIYAYQYDLVCNGVELSSGAVRNHDPEIMVKAFELVRLGEDDVKAKVPGHVQRLLLRCAPRTPASPRAWTVWSCSSRARTASARSFRSR